MRTSRLIGVVIGVHCLAIGMIFLIQGCGTTRGPANIPPEPIMPPGPEVATEQKVGAPNMPALDWPVETTTYTVRRGDSLSVIAKKYNVSVKEIMTLNGMSNANMVRVGQKLTLPGKIAVEEPIVVNQPKDKPVVISHGGEYIVQKGDCLSKIAVRHGTTTQAIKEANGLPSDKVIVGKKLIIPGGTQPAASPTSGVGAEVSGNSLDTPPVREAPVSSVEKKTAVASDTLAGKDPATKQITTRQHTVEPGEDLTIIAKMWGIGVDELRNFNGLASTSVEPGQVLLIPMAE